MRISLDIGGNSVEINYTDPDYDFLNESNINWGRIAENLFFPALRAMGYVIDHEWSSADELEGSHKESYDWSDANKSRK
jgi:hypothetical protein